MKFNTGNLLGRAKIRIEDIDPDSQPVEILDASRELDNEVIRQGTDDFKVKDENAKDNEALQWYEEIIGHALEQETDPNSSFFTFEMAQV